MAPDLVSLCDRLIADTELLFVCEWTVIRRQHDGLSVQWINSRSLSTKIWTTAYTTYLRLSTMTRRSVVMELLIREKNVTVATHLPRLDDFLHHHRHRRYYHYYWLGMLDSRIVISNHVSIYLSIRLRRK